MGRIKSRNNVQLKGYVVTRCVVRASAPKLSSHLASTKLRVLFYRSYPFHSFSESPPTMLQPNLPTALLVDFLNIVLKSKVYGSFHSEALTTLKHDTDK
ncbi:hypothetical protein J6590_088842 [Homalodisca vitripennis]|nr:hypothetical protein J6590_088842 [Homalodisca vitripennis]